MDDAATAAGSSNFGDPSFIGLLETLAASFDKEAQLNAGGRAAQRAQLVRMLVGRAGLETWIRRFPEILDEDIGDPLFIIGLPRTGTTLLYRMLSVADGFVSPVHYEVTAPVPDPDWDFTVAGDARIARAELAIAQMLEASPDLASIYPYEARAPEEDIFLLEYSFCSTNPPAMARVPTYLRSFLDDDKLPAYRYLRRMLKFLQWQRRQVEGGDFRPKRWLLKSPNHLHGFEAIFQEFPEAQIIQTHRDPIVTIPSICSFIKALHVMSADNPDALEIGRDWSRMFAQSMANAISFRDARSSAFLDIQYADTVSDQRGVIDRIFEFVGKNATAETHAEVDRWREANRREGRPEHHYTLEEFGLSKEKIFEDFAVYRSRFVAPFV